MRTRNHCMSLWWRRNLGPIVLLKNFIGISMFGFFLYDVTSYYLAFVNVIFDFQHFKILVTKKVSAPLLFVKILNTKIQESFHKFYHNNNKFSTKEFHEFKREWE